MYIRTVYISHVTILTYNYYIHTIFLCTFTHTSHILYTTLRHTHRFPRRPWIDVVSKGDIEIPEHIRSQLPVNYISISVANGYNIDKLKKEIECMLFNLRDILMERGV